MLNRIFLFIAALTGLCAVCLALPYAALSSEYAAMRDGPHAVGTVVRVGPEQHHFVAEIDYTDRRGHKDTLRIYPLQSELALYPKGGSVDLLVGKGILPARNLEKHRPSILLACGAVFMGLLFVACLWLDRALRVDRSRRSEPLDVLVLAIARTRNLRLAGAILFVLMASFLLAVPIAAGDEDPAMAIGVGAIGVLALGVAAWMGSVAYQLRDPWHNPILDLIVVHPVDLAWFYVLHEIKNGIPSLTAMLHTAQGKRHGIRLDASDESAVLNAIARHAPHAARGYSVELEKAYRENPARWRPLVARAQGAPSPSLELERPLGHGC